MVQRVHLNNTAHRWLYWFPRDCPRATWCAGEETSDEDVERWLDGDRTRRVAVIEARWLERMHSVELYAHRRNIELHGYGSTTFKKEMADRGAEPDECYLIGEELRDYPHIVLEVVHSSPLLNKLDVYSAMGILEVWVFQEGIFRIYALAANGAYGEQTMSRLMPTLDRIGAK